MFKPIFKTLLLSVFCFVLLVALGMKYHWVDLLDSSKSDIELILPQSSPALETRARKVVSEPSFPLEIIHSTKQPITANMSKQQILEGCLQLYNKIGLTNDTMIDVIVGDCVVSNYQETIQDTSVRKKSPEQVQQRRTIEHHCYQQVNNDARFTAIEKQLLWGVCVSDSLSAN